MRSDPVADRFLAFARSHVLLMDTVLAGVLFLVTVLPATTSVNDAEVGISLFLVAPLILRRTWPMFTFVLVTAVSLFQLGVLDDFLTANVSALIVIYTVAAYGQRWAGRVVLATGLLGAPLGAGVYYNPAFGSDAFVTVTFTIAVSVVAAWALGTVRRSRLQHIAGLAEQARLREQERQQELRLAASTERGRIAREMHDVVAHSLSVVIAQADGGRYAGRESPETALQTLEAIAATGRQALSDMRSLLGVLRDDGTALHTPQPQVGDLCDLVGEVRASGLDVDFFVEGDPRPLPAGQSLAAYRIVQESLTNVLKHAGPACRAWVRVQWRQDSLELSVIDDGRGASAALVTVTPMADAYPTMPLGQAADPGGYQPNIVVGHGLTGMNERATLYGGSVDAGPRSGGGFAVHAVIPYPRAP
ncbi:MAG: sensor histidine kinase [Geodermatophilaceae bacterium]